MQLKKYIEKLLPTRSAKITACIFLGIICGLGLFTIYAARMHTYISDKPETCVNCHIMGTYFATWQHSSHSQHTTCNDCHVPHTNFIREYYFHAKDGLRHATIYTLRNEAQAPQAIVASQNVIMENCIRCHTQLNTEFVKNGTKTFAMTQEGDGKACWDCHRDIPHGGKNSTLSTPNAIVPYPSAQVPEWINKAKNK